jgi:curved DNA-binding protein CbpA
MSPDLYAVLGVAPTDTPEQIRRAYRALLRRHHPDTRGAAGGRGGGDGERDEALQRALAAYAVLGDQQARARYDATRRERAAPRGHPVEVRRTAPRRAVDDVQPDIRVGPVLWRPSSR